MRGARRLTLAALATLVVVAAVVCGALGVASGEGPAGSTATRYVSVQGVGVAPIGVADNAEQADAVYREGMAKALADGQSKAAFLAEKAGVGLGVAVTITEDGGGIECSGTEGENSYPQYEGEQPDFGYGRATPVAAVAPESAASTGAPTVSHRPKARRKKHVTAHPAVVSDVHCNLTANVSEVYAVG